MILVLNLCKEKLHYYEFVRPVEDVLRMSGLAFFTKHYNEIEESDVVNVTHIIICGTSLKDCEYLKDIDKFSWIKNFEGNFLGICAGAQILGVLFGGELASKLEIGFFDEKINKSFLGFQDKIEVYHLHNNYVDFSKVEKFEVYCGNEVSQVVKHLEKNFYGVLFHPEVRNKKMIVNFARL